MNTESKVLAIRGIEKDLLNRDASLKYRVPPNTISTWVKNKVKYLKALEDKCKQVSVTNYFAKEK